MEKQTILLIIDYAVRILIMIVGTYVLGLIRKYKLEKWVKIAVTAAEQMHDAGLIEVPKKDYVIEFINNKFKFGITEQELDNLIESAVKELNLIQRKNN